jgi:hypothetical protein
MQKHGRRKEQTQTGDVGFVAQSSRHGGYPSRKGREHPSVGPRGNPENAILSQRPGGAGIFAAVSWESCFVKVAAPSSPHRICRQVLREASSGLPSG